MFLENRLHKNHKAYQSKNSNNNNNTHKIKDNNNNIVACVWMDCKITARSIAGR